MPKKPRTNPRAGGSGRSTNKVKATMHEYKHGTLHSGSKTGPVVKSRKQAVAIGLSQQRKANKGRY